MNTLRIEALGLAVVIGLACSNSRPMGTQNGGATAPLPFLTAGRAHTCAIFGGGAVTCWGDNGDGQLGRSGSADPLGAYSVDLGAGRRAAGVFAGLDHTCAILDGGDIKCWGLNDVGQLGLGDAVNRGDGRSGMGDALAPVDLGAGQRAVWIAAGAAATCVLLETGRVKCWGDAYGGALGYGDNVNRGADPDTMGDALPVIDLGSRDGAPLLAKTVVALDYHSFCAILEDPPPGTSGLKCWGSNDYCELGLGTTQGGQAGMPGTTGDNLLWTDLGLTASGASRRAVGLSGGYQFICALGEDGAVLCWGDNLGGQLGVGAPSPPRSCKPDETGDAGRVSLPGPAVAVAARGGSDGRGAHACALLASGAVLCWGENGSGQLGTGDLAARPGPGPPIVFEPGFVPARLVAGDKHTCAISADQRAKCWGSSQDGQLGAAAKGDSDAPGPDLVWHGPQVQLVAAGYDHTCALLERGALKCWGRNLEGQLGVGDRVNRGDQPAQLGDALPAVALSGARVTALAAGAAHSCAVLESGDVTCWGDNSAGQLGTGDTAPLMAPGAPVALGGPASAIAAGVAFTCAALKSGAVRCWGDNSNGQLGTGDMIGHPTPGPAVAALGARAIAVAAGDAHACALLASGRVACWGANGDGELGVGDTVDRARPTLVEFGWSVATAIWARGNETCALSRTGAPKCWGANARGQLGLGDASVRAVPPAMPIDLGAGRIASTLAIGAAFSCALLDTAQVRCWGDNASSQLGTSLTGAVYGDHPGQTGDALPPVVIGGGRSVRALAAGRAHACAVLDTGDLHCWGDNTYGQLGAGDANVHSYYSSPTVVVDVGHGS